MTTKPTKKYDYRTVHVKTDTYREIKRVAGEIQAKSGKNVTANDAISTVFSQRKKSK